MAHSRLHSRLHSHSRRHSFMALIITLMASLILGACSDIQVKTLTIPQPPEHNRLLKIHDSRPMAGAVSVDITPPPGLAMGGYSMMANKGTGFRTRLKARIIYLNDGQGHSTALVQTDLTSGSLLLQHKVASLVADNTDLHTASIVISASHSHSAPVNHFENDFYNKHMSSNPGLQLEYFEFLATRIAAGITKAYRGRRLAMIASGKKDLYGYNRNRSLDAYRRNKNIDPGVTAADDDTAKFMAVNPTLYMTRIDVVDDHGHFKPLAAYSSFSVHATALSPLVDVYNADLFAYAQKDLQWAIEHTYATPWPIVHALTTGTQGDMAPALTEDDRLFSYGELNWFAAKKLGQGIGREAIELFESLTPKLSATILIQTAAREINIREHNSVEAIELCTQAAVGSPVAGGAFERRTPFIAAIPFFRGGHFLARRHWLTKGCQGNKSQLGFSYLQPLLEPKDSFPDTVLFQIIKINDQVILPLPFEVTTETGRRISARVKTEFERAGQSLDSAWVASNANGYFGYATTEEEYAAQYYEGGHTLYGRYTSAYLAAQLGQLSQAMLAHKGATPLQTLLPEWSYAVRLSAQPRVFYDTENTPTPSTDSPSTDSPLTDNLDSPDNPDSPNAPSAQRAVFERKVLSQPEHQDSDQYIGFSWRDVGTSRIDFHRPLVRVEVKKNNRWQTLFNQGQPITDEGYDLEVRHLGSATASADVKKPSLYKSGSNKSDLHREGMADYQVRWYNPLLSQTAATQAYRIVIHPRAAQPALISEVFFL